MPARRLVSALLVCAASFAFGCSSPAAPPAEPTPAAPTLWCEFSGRTCDCTWDADGGISPYPFQCEPDYFPKGALCCADAASDWSACGCEEPAVVLDDIGCQGDETHCLCELHRIKDLSECPTPPASTCCKVESEDYCMCWFDSDVTCGPTGEPTPSCETTAEMQCCQRSDGLCECSWLNLDGCDGVAVEVSGCEPRTGVCCLSLDGGSCECGKKYYCDDDEVETDHCSVELIAPTWVDEQVCEAGLVEVESCTAE
jgi:hypothetical protein